MELSDLKGKRALVLGLGTHGGGVAVARWLVKHGARVTVSDSKTRGELASSLRQLKGLPIHYVLGKHPNSLLRGCDMLIQNPGVPRDLPLLALAHRRGLPVENEASLFLKLCPSHLVLGVTGSKGKSTTTALLGAMLKRQWPRTVVAGNIRDQVMFGVLDKLSPRTPVVLELSSWHLEVTGSHRLRLPLGVVTNVLPEHLNRYRNLGDYAQAKANMLRYQRARDSVVLNYDNPVTRSFAKLAPSRVYWFSVTRPVTRGAYLRQGVAYFRDGSRVTKLFRMSDLKIVGAHNQANALAAACAAFVARVAPAKIRAAVKSFRGLHDRLELVREVRGVRYYNDTTATAPVATEAALEVFKGQNIVLIAGGTDKALDYTSLARGIRRHVDTLVLLPGSATVKLQKALKGFRSILLARSMAEAVRLAALVAPRGSAVLLSPGAASFGLFKHEFDRGEQFSKDVRRLHA
jgi:UDP-N-acetylmuramoylalanine--D-glutamate ligase